MRYLLIFGLFLLAACGGDSVTAVDGSTETQIVLDIVAGDRQVDTVARELAQPLVVQVMRQPVVAGLMAVEPAPGVLVNFRVVSGGGSVFAGAAITDSLGMAADRWTLGTVAGDQRTEVRWCEADGDCFVADSFMATAEPGPARRIVFPDTILMSPNERIAIPRSFRDEYGNVTRCGDMAGIFYDSEQPLGPNQAVWLLDPTTGELVKSAFGADSLVAGQFSPSADLVARGDISSSPCAQVGDTLHIVPR